MCVVVCGVRVWQGERQSQRGHRVNEERSTQMERQTGRVRTEGAWSQRDPEGGPLRAQRRGREREVACGCRGAQTPRPGHRRGRKEGEEPADRGEGRKAERGSAGLVSPLALDAECYHLTPCELVG